MGVASLILGIFSVVCGFIPFIGFFALMPAFAGLVLGIIDIVMKSKAHMAKGLAITGTILSVIALVFIPIWFTIMFAFMTYDSSINLKEKPLEIESNFVNEHII